jgi:hypothetical protein
MATSTVGIKIEAVMALAQCATASKNELTNVKIEGKGSWVDKSAAKEEKFLARMRAVGVFFEKNAASSK